MAIKVTTRAVSVRWLEQLGAAAVCTVEIPAGTQLHPVTDGLGKVHWAVASEGAVVRLTGNSHDAKHRWLFVPDHTVGDQVEVAAVEAEPWRVRLTYHVTQYRVAELDVPRSFASDERTAAVVAMDMVRTNPALLAAEEADDVDCCDVEVDNVSWRDESGDYGI